jgi:hypothetical protein
MAPLFLTGCGSSGKGLGARAAVQGKVTLDGQPLKLGDVMFVPDETKGTKGPPAVGSIDASGVFTLTTDRESHDDGALVGFHRVRVFAVPQPAKPEDPPPPSLIPLRYNDEATSGLTAEVKAGQDNTIDLKLSSKQ